MNVWVQEYGVWVIGALFSLNLFFAQRIVSSVDDSSKAITVLQTQMRSFDGAASGYVDLRIAVSKLETKMESLSEEFRRSTRK